MNEVEHPDPRVDEWQGSRSPKRPAPAAAPTVAAVGVVIAAQQPPAHQVHQGDGERPASAAATRQPNGSYPKGAMPAPISHFPSGGCVRLASSVMSHTAWVPITYQHASRA